MLDQRNRNAMKSPGLGASGAWAVRTPGPRRLPGRRHWLSYTIIRSLQVCFLLHYCVGSVTAKQVQDSPADTQGLEQSPAKPCPPGSHLLVEDGTCKPCVDGVGFTNHSNSLPSCIPCRVCKEDKEEKRKCTPTRDTECQCKPGTFEDKDSTEFCQKCSECTDKEVEDTPCTPKGNRKCVPKDTGTSQYSFTWIVSLIIGILLLTVAFVLWMTGKWRLVLQFVKRVYPGCERDSEFVNSVRESERGNAVALLDLQTSSLETDSQHSMVSPAVKGPAEARSSSTQRKLLVPANGNDPTEALKAVFRQCTTAVPFKSWDSLMLQMGLTDNDIQVVRAETQVTGNALYQMLLKWLNQTGRSASINHLLDALQELGERYAMEQIEEYAVSSGKFVYQKATAKPGGGDACG